ncbi:NIPSNAP family protein [Ramlibacter terrae]|uniref:NIPSNAP family protein n=1 Tax=Ramlibacter terrae TaxID=2732511 RepID=A0ABX6P9E2_9BURK|nr:NIPSNAP family protein [Ramlibacter terrae]
MLPAPPSPRCTVVELRQYTLHPGQRDTLIDVFDREFVETQEAVGARVIGQFRDADRPDRFVWLRGFAGMAERAEALGAFYGGPAWAAHSAVANATMIDFDDVLLLRPAWEGSGVTVQRPRPPATAGGDAAGLVDITIFPLHAPPSPALLQAARNAGAVLRDGGAQDTAWYVTEPSANTFPRLPVREGVQVLVGVALFAGSEDFEAFKQSERWERDAAPGLSPHLAAPAQSLRLRPTARSALRA